MSEASFQSIHKHAGDRKNTNNVLPFLSEPSLQQINLKDESINLNDSRLDLATMIYYRAKHRMQRSKAGFLGKQTTEQTLANKIERIHAKEISLLKDRIDELKLQKEEL